MNAPGGALNLELDPQGYWYARNQPALSYPEDGNESCFTFEDDSFWFRHRNDVIRCLVEQYPPGGLIFDVGGGNGYVSAGLERAGFPTVVVEPGRSGAENACRRGLRSVVNATLEAAQFASAVADAVGLFDVLEHIEDEADFLASIRQLLKPGGRIYLTVPAFQMLWSNEDTLAGHFRRYTRASLTRVLQAAGFQVEFATYFFCVLPFPVFFLRSIPSRLGWRKDPSLRRSRQEHVRRGFVGQVLDRVWSGELAWLKRRRWIPLGGSCFAVARLPSRHQA